MITAEGNPRHHGLVSRMLFSLLHDPIFLTPFDTLSTETITTLSPVEAIQTIQTLLTNTDPSPTLVSTALSPIATSLYALLETLVRVKTADPALRESVRGLLLAWGRVVPADEAVAVLWACIDGQGGDWSVDFAGNVKRVEKYVCALFTSPMFLFEIRQEKLSSLALFTPNDLKKAEECGAFDIDANYLGLRPDPAHFVDFLKLLDRPDVSSEVFVRLLEGYRDSKADSESNPLR